MIVYLHPSVCMLQGYRSTCLDRVDTNYKWHREALCCVANLLEESQSSPTEDADDIEDVDISAVVMRQPDHLLWSCEKLQLSDEDCNNQDHALSCPLLEEAIFKAASNEVRFTQEEWNAFQITNVSHNNFVIVPAQGKRYMPGMPLLAQLIEFSRIQRLSVVGDALVCKGKLSDNSQKECIDGKCNRCGFQRLWSAGLRPNIWKRHANGVDERVPNSSTIWERTISWYVQLVGL